MRIVMAKSAADFLRTGTSPEAAAEASVCLLAERTGGTGGLILLARDGTPAAAFNTPRMAWGLVSSDSPIQVFV
jgi:isoaspartyl peptidase/L-asparaginase-like protein (Ntn-hydrolase superfamily)